MKSGIKRAALHERAPYVLLDTNTNRRIRQARYATAETALDAARQRIRHGAPACAVAMEVRRGVYRYLLWDGELGPEIHPKE